MMQALIEKFPEQLKTAVAIAKSQKLKKFPGIKNVYIAGLGGSGIGGTIASELVFTTSKYPITIGKGYFIPNFVSADTLVIISSYSGNTEETLNAFKLALKKKAKIVAVTSGGEVENICKKNKLDCVLIPGGMPPRSCLGYSLVQVLNILEKQGVIAKSVLNNCLAAAELQTKEIKNIQKEAKKIADFLFEKTPVIYTTTSHEGIAIRWRQQINENAKMLCWHHVVPEMNHNELVGWRNKNENLAVLFLLFNNEYERNVKRIESNKKVIKKYTPHIHTIIAKGKSEIEQTFYLNAIADWVSIYLAEKNKVIASEIKVIDSLKSQLKTF